jgi:hypothetical protein
MLRCLFLTNSSVDLAMCRLQSLALDTRILCVNALGLSAFGSGLSEHFRLEMVRDLTLDHGELTV